MAPFRATTVRLAQMVASPDCDISEVVELIAYDDGDDGEPAPSRQQRGLCESEPGRECAGGGWHVSGRRRCWGLR